MPNWIVAGHAWGTKATGPLRKLVQPTEKFEYAVTMIPPLIQFVLYTRQNAEMGMDYGWDFWDALTRGLFGGEAGAYAKCHKVKGPGSVVPDYVATGDNAFPTGVFEVCTNGMPTKVMTIDPGDQVRLSSILKEAFKTRGVRRVYWGCCTELDNQSATYTRVNTRW